jgi:hypothetical protein
MISLGWREVLRSMARRRSAILWGREFDTRLLRRLVQAAVALVLLMFCLTSAALLARHVPDLFLLDDAGYADSYVLYDVLRVQRTGVIYRDLSQPPYLPSLYSPLVYVVYSLPGRLFSFANPFLGPRLLSILAFVVCGAIVVSLVRALVPVRCAAIWGGLLACTVRGMWSWFLLIRSDFLGIGFTLLAVRLLMSRRRWMPMLAGISAGLATQFKLTFIAAIAAGALWLSFRREWKVLSVFLAGAALACVGPYLVFLIREPRMPAQILALSRGVTDLPGCLKLTYQAITEPVVLFAVAGMPLRALRISSRWGLLTLFIAISFGIAVITELQAGGAFNYFFEAQLAVIPVSVMGILRLTALAGQRILVGLFLAGLVGARMVEPNARELRGDAMRPRVSVKNRNDEFRKLERVLQGRRIFSTVPRLAVIDPLPPLTEPFLLGTLQRSGVFNAEPLLRRIRSGEFDIVITFGWNLRWRTLVEMGPELRAAIAAFYRPACAVSGYLVYLPANPRATSTTLSQELKDIGCLPVPAPAHP